MSPERIKEFLKATPFKPFTICTGVGSTVDVLSKEFPYLKPGNRMLEVSVPRIAQAREEADYEEHNIDVFLITKVITPPKRHGRNGRDRKN